jgi:hypothetical protein
MDRGKEFAAEVRDELQNEYGVIRKLITTQNPQVNSMVERAHQTIHDMIATQNIERKQDLPGGSWAGILSAVAFAMQATIHTTMRAMPMQLVYNRDAIHNIWFEADWQYIKERRQKVIVQNNDRARIPHTYSVGDQVMIEQYQHHKYGSPRYKGPYAVDTVNDNGTIHMRHDTANGGAVYQMWNILATEYPSIQGLIPLVRYLSRLEQPSHTSNLPECAPALTHMFPTSVPNAALATLPGGEMQYTSFLPLMTHSQHGIEGSPDRTSTTQMSPNHERACHERECSDVSVE